MWTALLLIALGLLPASIAYKKHKSFFTWWLYGIVLPFIALPHALLLPPVHPFLAPRTPRTVLRYCDKCGQYPNDAATICASCGAELPTVPERRGYFEWEAAIIVGSSIAMVVVIWLAVRHIIG
jgi:hypothetical protein